MLNLHVTLSQSVSLSFTALKELSLVNMWIFHFSWRIWKSDHYYLLHFSELIITCDFNIHVDDLSNRNVSKFMDLLSTYGFVQHIFERTHRYGHCRDLLITRERGHTRITKISVHPGLSDHFAIMTSLCINKPLIPHQHLVAWRALTFINFVRMLKHIFIIFPWENVRDLDTYMLLPLKAFYKI